MSRKTILRVAAIISGVSGIVILFSIVYPIISYRPAFISKGSGLISPLVDGSGSSKVDYTQASNWFTGGATKQDFLSSNVEYYTISIPKLRISDASVAIGGEDLTKNLIQYPGTALPGKRGNAVIFGHSTLPLFYNPKNYLAIFSLLPSLKVGDEIDVSYDGISYKYRVETMFEVHPTDIQVLDQDESDSFLTLVTCVPPGDPTDPGRLIVRARVVPPEEAAYENIRN